MAATATKSRKTKTVTTTKKLKNTAVASAMRAKTAAALVAAARIMSCRPSEIKKIADNIRTVLCQLGTADRRPDGRIVVYANKSVQFNFSKARHTKNAKRREDGNCPIAKAFKESFLGDYVDNIHVGNHTVSIWSVLCPDVVVKFALSGPLLAAVREWDEKHRWTYRDGIYALAPYSPSLRRGAVHRVGSVGPRGPRTRSPSRRVTLRSDVTKAIAAATAAA